MIVKELIEALEKLDSPHSKVFANHWIIDKGGHAFCKNSSEVLEVILSSDKQAVILDTDVAKANAYLSEEKPKS